MEDYKKKYQNALEWVRSIYPSMGDVDKEDAKHFFPELKVIEDEKIRNEIILYIGARNDISLDTHNKWLSWLEEQGESKPIGKLQLSEELYEHIRNTCACIDDALSSETLADINDYLSMAKHSAQSAFDMIEKQGEKPGKSIIEAWKDMRLEVYQQASGNRHEPNCSDDNTKMFSLNDIDEIIEKLYEK